MDGIKDASITASEVNMSSTVVDIPSLVSKLTLEEKISLLAGVDWWRTFSVDRDGVLVPQIKFTDGPNGARGESYVSGIKAACFPCGTSLGSTFDSSILEKRVARADPERHSFSPGGRNYETYSEDPFLLGVLAAAYVRGCQAEGTVAATPKHFVANDAENQRTTLSVEVDEQTLREIYLKPFQLVAKLSDPWCFMTSYNRINGEYVADSRDLVTNVLREEWGFNGVVVSDWMGTYSVAPGINAGVDIEMPGLPKWRKKDQVLKLVDGGQISKETIDDSVHRILELAKRLGRFEDPTEPPEREVQDAERDALIETSAAEGIVVLKNDNNVLPIPKGASVALIGHHATSVVLGGGGSARVDALHAITPVEGFEKRGHPTSVALGVPVFGAIPHADPSIIFAPGSGEKRAEPVKLEWFNGLKIGENKVHEETRPQAEYMIKEKWPDYLDPVEYCTRITFDLVATSSGDAMFGVISTGAAKCYIDDVLAFERVQETKLRPESFYFFKKQLEKRFTFKQEAGRRYKIRLESWACEPKILNAAPLFGKMVASACDYAVVCVGNTNEIESEGFDRDTMDLNPDQYKLIDAVNSANSKTAVVSFCGAPVSLTQFIDSTPAVVQAWFPGQETGHSVASVLTGAVNPSGRLPLSWPKKLEDNSSFKNFPVGEDGILRYEEGLDVGYRWYDREASPDPLFPFGYGLSYSKYVITKAEIDGQRSITDAKGTITIKAQVQNIGPYDGKVVVQFYIASPDMAQPADGSFQKRPLKELQGFSKVEVAVGQTQEVGVELDKYSVSTYDAQNKRWQAREGEYSVLVGLSSVDIAHSVLFRVDKEFTWTGL
uniref:beta-glucosidase n=1 Tax=Bionectria ochroleuca TaxID=29856 RepID=A0A8H7K6F1_BIOOC